MTSSFEIDNYFLFSNRNSQYLLKKTAHRLPDGPNYYETKIVFIRQILLLPYFVVAFVETLRHLFGYI